MRESIGVAIAAVVGVAALAAPIVAVIAGVGVNNEQRVLEATVRMEGLAKGLEHADKITPETKLPGSSFILGMIATRWLVARLYSRLSGFRRKAYWRLREKMSAYGPKPTWDVALHMFASDPKRAISGNNHAHLKSKSSSCQSLRDAFWHSRMNDFLYRRYKDV